MAEQLALEGEPDALPGDAAPEISPGTIARKTRRRTNWRAEARGVFWLLLAVLGFHSFIAKPFYIPSESMLPGLEVGDRLVVNKFAYGWSFVSPTIPNPVVIVEDLLFRQHHDSWTFQLPAWHGRLFGRLPERGDVVIVTPPGTNNDYIKRVIGLPGDRLEVRDGVVVLNGRPLQRGPLHYVDLADYGGVLAPDGQITCAPDQYPANAQSTGPDGKLHCRLPVITETLPGGRHYDTVELGPSRGDNYPPVTIPADHVFLMGDNRDRSSDSRFPLGEPDKGLGGPVPWENIGGRAEFITFSLDGSTTWNPLTWLGAFRSGRAGNSLHPAAQ